MTEEISEDQREGAADDIGLHEATKHGDDQKRKHGDEQKRADSAGGELAIFKHFQKRVLITFARGDVPRLPMLTIRLRFTQLRPRVFLGLPVLVTPRWDLGPVRKV